MKLPNGVGNVSKLSGNRRNPWCARKPVGRVGGKVVYEYVGYYKTRKEAIEALMYYQPKSKNTVKEIYLRWTSERNVSESTLKTSRSVYNAISPLHDKVIASLTLDDLQGAIDEINAISIKQQARSMLVSIYKYAMAHEIVDRNRAEFIKVPPQEKSNAHKRFTKEEVSVLWSNVDDSDVRIVLTLIYTGLRISEYIELEDIHDDYIRVLKGKTKSAERTIPLRNGVPFLFGGVSNYNQAREVFRRLQKYGMNHIPHDTRHTFASMWADYGLDRNIRDYIMGHSPSGTGEKVYTHYDFDVLTKEVNKLDIS